MIERLHRTIEELEQLPPDVQDEAAARLEALISESQKAQHVSPQTQRALDLIGSWSDIPWDEMEAALDRIRHESEPTPPIDEL